MSAAARRWRCWSGSLDAQSQAKLAFICRMPALFVRGGATAWCRRNTWRRTPSCYRMRADGQITAGGHAPQLEQPQALAKTCSNSWMNETPEARLRASHFSETAYPCLPPADT